MLFTGSERFGSEITILFLVVRRIHGRIVSLLSNSPPAMWIIFTIIFFLYFRDLGSVGKIRWRKPNELQLPTCVRVHERTKRCSHVWNMIMAREPPLTRKKTTTQHRRPFAALHFRTHMLHAPNANGSWRHWRSCKSWISFPTREKTDSREKIYKCDEVYLFFVAICSPFIIHQLRYFIRIFSVCYLFPRLPLAAIPFFRTHFSAHYIACIPSVIPHHVQQLHLLVKASILAVLNIQMICSIVCESTHTNSHGRLAV